MKPLKHFARSQAHETMHAPSSNTHVTQDNQTLFTATEGRLQDSNLFLDVRADTHLNEDQSKTTQTSCSRLCISAHTVPGLTSVLWCPNHRHLFKHTSLRNSPWSLWDLFEESFTLLSAIHLSSIVECQTLNRFIGHWKTFPVPSGLINIKRTMGICTVDISVIKTPCTWLKTCYISVLHHKLLNDQ